MFKCGCAGLSSWNLLGMSIVYQAVQFLSLSCLQGLLIFSGIQSRFFKAPVTRCSLLCLVQVESSCLPGPYLMERSWQISSLLSVPLLRAFQNHLLKIISWSFLLLSNHYYYFPSLSPSLEPCVCFSYDLCCVIICKLILLYYKLKAFCLIIIHLAFVKRISFESLRKQVYVLQWKCSI